MPDYASTIGEILKRGGLSAKDIWFSGRTGHATFYSEDAARRACMIFQAATFRTRGPVRAVDYLKDRGSNLNPAIRVVWRVGFYAN